MRALLVVNTFATTTNAQIQTEITQILSKAFDLKVISTTGRNDAISIAHQAQDYEIILRKKKIKIKKIDKIISVMRDGGITNTNQFKALKYFMKAQIKNKTNKIHLCVLIYLYGVSKIIIKNILNKLSII